MKKRSAWFAAWFAVLIIGVVAMRAAVSYTHLDVYKRQVKCL